jgi:hypothetical protein
MRRTLGLLGVLGLASVGVVACNETPGISNVQLGFTIVEGILEVQEGDPTTGAIILSSTGGNCPAYQRGLSVRNILLTDALVTAIQNQTILPDGGVGFLPLTAGTYNIEEGLVDSAGLYAATKEFETTGNCAVTPTGANSGTVTLQPFNPSSGGISTVSYSFVFGLDQFTGAAPLNTCIIPADATGPDAGTCELPANGGTP